MWTNAILKGLLIFFRAILIPVEMVTTFVIGLTFLIPFWPLIYVFLMTIIWFPFSLYIVSTSWLYQKAFILRPILAIISIPVLIVLDSFLGIMPNPEKADKYNKALIIDSWPFSSWSDIHNMPFMDEWRGFKFPRRQPPNMPLLVEALKAGELIVFDEEEQRAIDREIKYQHDNYYKNMTFPKDVAEEIRTMFATGALRELAKSKLISGDLKGAASTCTKLLGLSAIYEGDWLLLAEIFAEHGDVIRSKGFLDKAKEVHKKNRAGEPSEFEPVWKNNIQRVQDIIKSKESK